MEQQKYFENPDDLRFDFSIDRGGTFTDIYCQIKNMHTHQQLPYVMKLLSVDPQNYKDAPTEGIRRVLSMFLKKDFPRTDKLPTNQINSIRMGTTVATNALLERKGDRVALLISKGLRDVLQIGNQSRPKIFDLEIKKPDIIYEEVLEVDERIRPLKDFEQTNTNLRIVEGINKEKFVEVQELDLTKVRQQLEYLKYEKKFDSLAVVLMHSYLYPQHEELIGKVAQELGFNQISLSSSVMSRVKMVKRGQTCCVDAYLNPHILRYIAGFKQGFDDKLLERVAVFFMQSDGGLAHVDQFSGSKAILSGPAGGVVGYSITTTQYQEEIHGKDKSKYQAVIGFDMGGTSTDVSRFQDSYEHIFETELAGVSIQAPQLNINTVAAGGGSRLFYENGLFKVGPESAGADPGPVCYRKLNGQLAVTDANLVLGRLLPEYFPKIFGPKEDQPLDREGTRKTFYQLTEEINAYYAKVGQSQMTVEDVALGFIRVANESMCRPIRALTQSRGFNPKTHILNIFGGAGGQHACAIAKDLGIKTILIHKYCGILSAYGLGLADVVQEKEEPCLELLSTEFIQQVEVKYDTMAKENSLNLKDLGFAQVDIEHIPYLNLRYEGTDTQIMVEKPQEGDYKSKFEDMHKREFGFILSNRRIFVDNIRVRSVGKNQTITPQEISKCTSDNEQPAMITQTKAFFEIEGQAKALQTPVFDLESLKAGMKIEGPALILNKTSTILVELGCIAKIDNYGSVVITIGEVSSRQDYKAYKTYEEVPFDSIELSIFGHRFMSIAEQMGITLQRTSVSTNIKERLDFSCALFDPEGNLVANAPHLPVHLGSMQEAVRYQINLLGNDWKEGEVILTNHPVAGGTHLPDMTVISPVFHNGIPIFYVASRGHHADIGGIQPGSMPSFSKALEEEGAAIESFKLVKDGQFQEEALTNIMCNQTGKNPLIRGTRNLSDNLSDFKAQVAANNRGIMLVQSLIEEYSLAYVQAQMKYIQSNAEQSVRLMLRELSLKWGLKEVDTVQAVDYMDDGSELKLSLTIDRNKMEAFFDFEGTDPEMYGNCNAPRAITYSAIIYCLRCLVNAEIPLNQGCLNPIQVNIPQGTFLNPSSKAAVVGGNVQTSQRITDVVLKAFKACAASQGDMNNLTFGDDKFGYYETIAGGAGAGPHWHGQSGVHTHMTNTRITDPEILEMRYPVILREFNIRQGSGGNGKFKGGNGVIREIEFLKNNIQVGIISERRAFEPYGMDGGDNGQRGKNLIIYPDGRIQNFGAKNTIILEAGSRIRIMTPGGGGYGKAEQ